MIPPPCTVCGHPTAVVPLRGGIHHARLVCAYGHPGPFLPKPPDPGRAARLRLPFGRYAGRMLAEVGGQPGGLEYLMRVYADPRLDRSRGRCLRRAIGTYLEHAR